MASEGYVGRRAFLAGTAAALAAPTVVRAADLIPITIGLTPGDPAAVLFYASERGFFRNAGLDAKLNIMNSGPVVATAVTGGSLDLGAVNVGSLASARLRGLPLRIVAPAAIVTAGPSGDAAMVRKESTIRAGADFNNKTVGIVAIKTVQHAAFLAWVDKHGGDSKTIKSIEIPLPEMAAALDQSRVDVTIPVEPFTSQAVTAGNRNLGSFYDSMKLPFLVFAIAGNEQWLQANVATATKAASAIRLAAAWANSHEKECREMLAPFMKIDQKTADTMLLRQFGTTINVALIAPVIDIMTKYGFLDKAVAPADMIWRPVA